MNVIDHEHLGMLYISICCLAVEGVCLLSMCLIYLLNKFKIKVAWSG